METPSTGQKGNRVLEFAEAHPYILLAAIVVLILVILIMMFGGSVPGISHIQARQRMKERLADESELDALIESIHNKQKKKK